LSTSEEAVGFRHGPKQIADPMLIESRFQLLDLIAFIVVLASRLQLDPLARHFAGECLGYPAVFRTL